MFRIDYKNALLQQVIEELEREQLNIRQPNVEAESEQPNIRQPNEEVKREQPNIRQPDEELEREQPSIRHTNEEPETEQPSIGQPNGSSTSRPEATPFISSDKGIKQRKRRSPWRHLHMEWKKLTTYWWKNRHELLSYFILSVAGMSILMFL
jgi:hypothetical protein